MKKILLILIAVPFLIPELFAQSDHLSKRRQRLDFARSYFEFGGNFQSGFTGYLPGPGGAEPTPVRHHATVTPYLKWGGFHFWGHADFYVLFPLGQYGLGRNPTAEHQLIHSVVTGGRWYPWAYREERFRPFLGVSWSALDLQQGAMGEEDAPVRSKDWLPVPEAGLMWGTHKLALGLSLSYLPDHQWEYPISTSQMVAIETPWVSAQLGLRYHFENSKVKDEAANARWNNYPSVSAPGWEAKRGGDLFVGIGPSSSFSLAPSIYNQQRLPWLSDRLSATLFFEISAGYQWNRAGLFAAASFRNPTFETTGYGARQTIRKTSLAFEVNKFITDFSGFAPYIGLNIAYDHIDYQERTDGWEVDHVQRGFEPGLTIGWDIIPGKTEEFLILRTNLRWYPFSDLQVGPERFRFNQLEYNLIQAIFYPGRFLESRRNKKPFSKGG